MVVPAADASHAPKKHDAVPEDYACLVLDINAETGLIEKVEEYYTKLWHQSVDVDEYRGQPAEGEKK